MHWSPCTSTARLVALVMLLAVPGSALAAEPGPRERLVIRPNGFLTGESKLAPADVALDYVRGHAGAFGLDGGDLSGLRLERSHRLRLGLERVQFAQSAHGIPTLGMGIRAVVDRDGRLVAVSGAPVPDLESLPTPSPGLDAAPALRRAAAAAGRTVAVRQLGASEGRRRETRFANGHQARLVWLPRGESVRLAWRVLLVADSQSTLDVVVDAETGALLMRRNLVKSGTGLAWDNYPGAPLGGTPASRDFSAAGWLSSVTRLQGPNAWVYADVEDNVGSPSAAELATQIAPSSGNWDYPQAGFPPAGDRSCPVASGLGTCSWDSDTGGSWLQNLEQSGTQAFYFVNRFHDHLESAPGIGFTPAAGGFEGSDPVHVQVLDGASGPGNLPDADHLSNANMTVLPDGSPPRMQMYLFGGAAGGHDVNGGDDAAIVYHEYTHGLNHRLLCCDADGFSLIWGPQSGAMDEAWADWFALDFLVAQGFVSDSAAAGELRFGDYENVAVRTQPVDCPPGGGGSACPGSPDPAACLDPVTAVPAAGPGGYTYGDFGRICQLDDFNNSTGANGADGVPDGEVHADGEIWASTLWDLRSAMVAAHGSDIGVLHTRALVTAGLMISPGFPDFVTMRNAILAANTSLGFGPGDCERIWAVFAARGIGADAVGGGDFSTTPTESFRNPAPAACGAAPAPPPPPAPPTSGTGTPAPLDLSGAPARLRISSSRRFSYSFKAAPGMRGSVTFRTRRKVRASRRSALVHLTVGRRSFTSPASGRVTVRVRLSRRHAAILRRNRRFLLRVGVSAQDSLGRVSRASRRLTLLPPR